MFALLRVSDHRTELQHGKRVAIQTAAFLAEPDWPRRSAFNQHGDEQEEPRKQHDGDKSQDHIEDQLDQPLPGRLRRGAEDQHRPAIEIIQAGTGDLGAKEVRHQPGFDAFQFAGLDGFFDLAEESVLGVDDDATRRTLVHEFYHLLDGDLVEVQFRYDFQTFIRFFAQVSLHPLGVALRAHQHDAPLDLQLAEPTAIAQLQELLARIDQKKADAAEEDDDQTRKLLDIQKEHHHDHAQGDKEAAFGEQPRGCSPRAK